MPKHAQNAPDNLNAASNPQRMRSPSHGFIRVALLVLLAPLTLLCITSCDRQPSATSHSKDDNTLLLLSASSLSDVLTRIATNYKASHGVNVNISSGGSNALARMILAGSPGDLFLSANNQWADVVEQQNLSVQRVSLLTNQLVLIVPKANPASIHKPQDLFSTADANSRLMLAGEQVPAGKYAQQALTHLHLYKKLIEQNKIARGHNVRQAMLYVETGHAGAGIVYATDARASDKVKVVYTFDAQTHQPITYSLLLLKSPNAAAAQGQRFFDYLQSPQALAVFQAHGFGVITNNNTEHDNPRD